MNRLIIFTAICIFSFPTIALAACQDRAYRSGYEYDARTFLTETERIAFNRIYPEFDEQRVEKSWEWKDVDPLGFFSVEDNRRRRREAFLFDLSPSEMNPKNDPPTVDQEAFRIVVSNEVRVSSILMDRRIVKIVTPYTKDYEANFPVCNFLEKLASLGLRWAQVGGTSLYLYNGAILMGTYKSGTARLASVHLDKPAARGNPRK